MQLKELLHNTLSIQSYSRQTSGMRRYLRRFAKKNNIAFDEDAVGNITMTKGQADIYPCMVAHTDTVHELVPHFKVLVSEGIYFGWNGDEKEFSGVGGDDKVGVAIALKMLLDNDVMKAAFVVDEEIGCIGSKQLDMSFFNDCSVVIQCDRRGNKDIVQSVYGEALFDDVFQEAIQPLIEKYGRQVTTGMLTDVYTLRKRGLETVSMNLSCGYYDPHTDKEYVVFSDVEATAAFVQDVFDATAHKRWPFQFTFMSQHSLHPVWPPQYHAGWGGALMTFAGKVEEEDDEEFLSFGSGDGILVHEDDFDDVGVCPNCGSSVVTYDDTVDMWYCMTCCDYLVVVNDEGVIV